MARAKKATSKPTTPSKRPIEQYDHKGQQRKNNPPVGLVTEATDRDAPRKPQPADASVARSGETLRQAEWRAELSKTGIRGKNNQMILFSRVEPLAGTRWLHADGEAFPNDRGSDRVSEPKPAAARAAARSAPGPPSWPLPPSSSTPRRPRTSTS